MKKTILIPIAFAVAVWYGCGNSNNESEHHHDGDSTHEHAEGTEHHHEEGEHHEGEVHVYSCPMHSEVKGKEGETCSKCGMKLEHTD